MEKWARRQDKVKMSFKQQQTPASSLTVEKSSVSNVMNKPTSKNVDVSLLEPIKVDINCVSCVIFYFS